MNRTAARLSVALLLLMLVPRLPAPISEESTPLPKPVATAKPRPKIVAPKPKPTPASFAGTWSGVTNGACSNDGANHNYDLTVVISADERTISMTSVGSTSQYNCYRTGSVLHLDYNNDVGKSTITFQMLAGGRSLSYSGRTTITTWPLDGTVCNSTGVLAKR